MRWCSQILHVSPWHEPYLIVMTLKCCAGAELSSAPVAQLQMTMGACALPAADVMQGVHPAHSCGLNLLSCICVSVILNPNDLYAGEDRGAASSAADCSGNDCSWAKARHGCKSGLLPPVMCSTCNTHKVHHVCIGENVGNFSEMDSLKQMQYCYHCAKEDPALLVLEGMFIP